MSGLLISNPVALPVVAVDFRVIPGDELNLLPGTYTGNYKFTWSNGSANYPITCKSYSSTVLVDGSIQISTEHVLIENLHIKDADFTNRTSVFAGSNPTDIPINDGVRVSVKNVTIKDCIIENVRQGISVQTDIENVVIDGCVIFYVGWDATDRPHGHGIYTHKGTTIRNCIIFSNSEFGAKVYGQDGENTDDCTLEDNIIFNNSVIFEKKYTRGNILFGNYTIDFYRPILRRNYTYQLPDNMIPDYYGLTNTNYLGFAEAFFDAVMVDNYMPDGCVIHSEEAWPSTFSENRGNVFEAGQVNKIVVIPVRNRLHVAVYNWETLETIEIPTDLTGSVIVRNVQDYFSDVQTTTVIDGKITASMLNRTVSTPQGWTAPSSTFPQFGCFIVESV